MRACQKLQGSVDADKGCPATLLAERKMLLSLWAPPARSKLVGSCQNSTTQWTYMLELLREAFRCCSPASTCFSACVLCHHVPAKPLHADNHSSGVTCLPPKQPLLLPTTTTRSFAT